MKIYCLVGGASRLPIGVDDHVINNHVIILAI